MNVPSKLARLSQRVARLVSNVRVHSHPPTLAAPRRVLFRSGHRLINRSLQARLFIPKSSLDQSKRARVSMLLPNWLVSPLDGAVAMLVLLRPWTSTALDLEI